MEKDDVGLVLILLVILAICLGGGGWVGHHMAMSSKEEELKGMYELGTKDGAAWAKGNCTLQDAMDNIERAYQKKGEARQ